MIIENMRLGAQAARIRDEVIREAVREQARRLVRQFVAEQGAALAEAAKLWDAPRIG